MAVICVHAGVHVWVRDGGITFRAPGCATVRLRADDAVEAAERIVELCEDLTALGSVPR